MTELTHAIEALKSLLEDSSLPKNVRSKIQETVTSLESTKPVSHKVSRAMEDLESISENLNLQSFVRTEIFNIVSMLEIVKP